MLAVAAFSALALAACGDQSALALAQQACGKVHASVVSYDAGIQASNPSTKARDLKKAENDLQEAEPLAAQATSADGQWNALMTTLNEIGQVDEKHLIAALQSQCAVANSGQPEIPNVPPTSAAVPAGGKASGTRATETTPNVPASPTTTS
jgi:hypothetical protein